MRRIAVRQDWIISAFLVAGCSPDAVTRPHETKTTEADRPSAASAKTEETTAPERKPSTPARFGPSWRLVEGRFEDLTGDYAIEAPKGWSLLAGERLPSFAKALPGTVGWIANGAPVEAVLSRRRVVTPAPELRDELAAAGIVTRGESTVQVNGRKHTSLLYLEADGREHQIARWCDGDRCTRLEFVYPLASNDARAAVARADFSLQRLSARERKELREELVARGRERKTSEGSLTLDGLRLSDSANGLSFTLPNEGPWEIHIGAAARQRTNQRWLLARCAHVETGLVFKYSANPVKGLTTNAAFHGSVVSTFAEQLAASIRTPKPRSTSIGSLAALETEFDMGGLRGRLVTATVDDRAVSLVITQDVALFDDHVEAIDRFVAGFEGDGR